MLGDEALHPHHGGLFLLRSKCVVLGTVTTACPRLVSVHRFWFVEPGLRCLRFPVRAWILVLFRLLQIWPPPSKGHAGHVPFGEASSLRRDAPYPPPRTPWGVHHSLPMDMCEQRRGVARCAFGEENSSRKCESGVACWKPKPKGFLPRREGRAGPRAVLCGGDTGNVSPRCAGTGSSSHASPTFQGVLALG